jgi:hypothetical protein
MNRVIARIELFWNENPYCGFALTLVVGAVAVYTGLYPASPGISIGLLAFAAGVMGVRPKMHFPEKIAWMIILIAFTYQEVRAIKRNDADNVATRNSQNAAFGVIVEDLKTSIQNSKDQYSQTVKHVNSVAVTTQKVADLARTNLEALTGGNSYAYVYPTAVEGSNVTQTLKIHNAGTQSLNLTMTIALVVQESGPGGCDVSTANRVVIPIGPIAPRDGRTLPNPLFDPVLRPDGTAIYQIWLNAQNAGVSERLQFRKPSGGGYLDFKLDVARQVTDKRRKSDVKICGTWIRYLKRVDWTTTRMEGTLK